MFQHERNLQICQVMKLNAEFQKILKNRSRSLLFPISKSKKYISQDRSFTIINSYKSENFNIYFFNGNFQRLVEVKKKKRSLREVNSALLGKWFLCIGTKDHIQLLY